MTYDAFQALTRDMLDEIPDEFLRGLQGVHVLEEARKEPGLDDVYRMGEYLDPGFDYFLGGSPGLGRHIALYYGSFAALAEAEEDFDWEAELWETLTHELRHHVESLAGEDALIQDDVRRDELFKRTKG